MGSTNILILDEALTIADAARKRLAEMGKKANICVVNREGGVLVLLGMNETKPMTRNIAKHKACQAACTGRRTRLVRDKVNAGEWGLGLLGLDKDTFCPIAGGIPIYSQNQVLLGVAV